MVGKYGEKYPGDSKYVAACRQLQSIYRVEIGEDIRPYKGHYYGNYIEGGERSGANFLSRYAFEYAAYRIENKKSYETINSDRLYNNLLSSQPMAFNLFAPLRSMLEKYPEIATSVIKSAFDIYPIHKVTDVDLEFIPDNYMSLVGDKSAMDAIIRFIDVDGRECFIAIETKYSENLGVNEASKKERALENIRALNCFRPDIENRISDGKIRLTQIYRNFLLSEMYGHESGLESCSLILAPERHPSTAKEVSSLSEELKPEFRHKICSVSLEDVLDRIISNSPEEYRSIFEKFVDRYLNFGKLDTI